MNTTTLLVTSSVLTMGTMASKYDDMVLTPPMGWNSWNLFGRDITEQDVIEIAEAMVNTDMTEVGYEYIVLDTSWQLRVSMFRRIVADPERFPHGIRFLTDYIHAKGLRFGIYASRQGTGLPETPGDSDQNLSDAMTYSHWDLDYLKYDWYYFPGNEATSLYTMMQQALYAVARPVIFNFHFMNGILPLRRRINTRTLNGRPVTL